MTQPTLRTARLALRPFTPADAGDVTALLQVPSIAANTLRIPFPYEQSMAEAWIATHPAEYEAQREITFAVTLAGDGRFIGAVGLVLEDEHRVLPMVRLEHGFFAVTTDAAQVGSRYRFQLEDGSRVPDPASRHQTNGEINGRRALVKQEKRRNVNRSAG